MRACGEADRARGRREEPSGRDSLAGPRPPPVSAIEACASCFAPRGREGWEIACRMPLAGMEACWRVAAVPRSLASSPSPRRDASPPPLFVRRVVLVPAHSPMYTHAHTARLSFSPWLPHSIHTDNALLSLRFGRRYRRPVSFATRSPQTRPPFTPPSPPWLSRSATARPGSCVKDTSQRAGAMTVPLVTSSSSSSDDPAHLPSPLPPPRPLPLACTYRRSCGLSPATPIFSITAGSGTPTLSILKNGCASSRREGQEEEHGVEGRRKT